MQAAGVVVPSSSPWASPVVMVRKRDETLQFCVDYREPSSVSKVDTFPGSMTSSTSSELPGFHCPRPGLRLLAKPDEPKFCRQDRLCTPHGLYQFQIMPFRLTNAPSVFQRLMEKALAGLNLEDGPDFVAVYIDDAIVFSVH